jgi:prepilin-type N-terminal cleavage/methylation domain-containing protein
MGNCSMRITKVRRRNNRDMARPMRRQLGYTFTEILVVIAIIGVLVALLLPAVQAAREAARRSNCQKNLEQLIIAVHNYEMLHQVYPPGTVNSTGPIQSLPQGYHHNWIIQLLPFIEQRNTYAHVDDLVGVYHANNMPVRRLDIEILSCPSAPRARRAYSDYAGVHNDVEAPIDVTNNGVFFLNSRISYFDLKDGSSNTLFIGEKETYAGDLGWMSGTRATLRNTGILINATKGSNWRIRRYWERPSGYPPGVASDEFPAESLLSDEETLDVLLGDEPERLDRLSAWRYTQKRETVYDENGFEADATYGAVGGITESDSSNEERGAKKLALSVVTKNPALAVGGFGSQHPGGAQFAIGDGSVRFCSQTIDPIVFLRLGHRADGQLTTDDW